MADAIQACTAQSPSTPGQPLERLEVEEPNEEDNINWPSGHKLWLNMASVFMTQIVLGLVGCSSFDERTLLTLTFRTSLLWLLPCPVSQINSIQWPTLVGIRQLSMYKPGHLSSKANSGSGLTASSFNFLWVNLANRCDTPMLMRTALASSTLCFRSKSFTSLA